MSVSQCHPVLYCHGRQFIKVFHDTLCDCCVITRAQSLHNENYKLSPIASSHVVNLSLYLEYNHQVTCSLFDSQFEILLLIGLLLLHFCGRDQTSSCSLSSLYDRYQGMFKNDSYSFRNLSMIEENALMDVLTDGMKKKLHKASTVSQQKNIRQLILTHFSSSRTNIYVPVIILYHLPQYNGFNCIRQRLATELRSLSQRSL